MSELTSQNEVDPLSGAASGWEAPKYPCLAPDRICEFKVVSAKQHTKEGESTPKSIAIVLATNKDYTDDEGKPLREGFKVTQYTGIVPVEPTSNKRGRTWKDIGADLAMILKACGMPNQDVAAFRDNPSIIEGSIVNGKTSISKETTEFPKQTRVRLLIPE